MNENNLRCPKCEQLTENVKIAEHEWQKWCPAHGNVSKPELQAQIQGQTLYIYISGPLTDNDSSVVQYNLLTAYKTALQIFQRGHIPYIPHLTHHLNEYFEKSAGFKMSYSDWIEYDKKWVDKCDALYWIGYSQGSHIELEYAKKLGKEIFYSIREIPYVNNTSQTETDSETSKDEES